eukprot:TRINITY_DN23971_c0_g1_i1.p1 TRINITY_DN23971_c0_g1~~TRINITY_DN23971_c0_g1_i1.p1  ORF type:complete len:304 (-),score=104.88 TRINITY_DN23971_c0_g1_i1:226-1137(-)
MARYLWLKVEDNFVQILPWQENWRGQQRQDDFMGQKQASYNEERRWTWRRRWDDEHKRDDRFPAFSERLRKVEQLIEGIQKEGVNKAKVDGGNKTGDRIEESVEAMEEKLLLLEAKMKGEGGSKVPPSSQQSLVATKLETLLAKLDRHGSDVRELEKKMMELQKTSSEKFEALLQQAGKNMKTESRPEPNEDRRVEQIAENIKGSDRNESEIDSKGKVAQSKDVGIKACSKGKDSGPWHPRGSKGVREKLRERLNDIDYENLASWLKEKKMDVDAFVAESKMKTTIPAAAWLRRVRETCADIE